MLDLPDELWAMVFGWMTSLEWGRVARTCHRFLALTAVTWRDEGRRLGISKPRKDSWMEAVRLLRRMMSKDDLVFKFAPMTVSQAIKPGRAAGYVAPLVSFDFSSGAYLHLENGVWKALDHMANQAWTTDGLTYYYCNDAGRITRAIAGAGVDAYDVISFATDNKHERTCVADDGSDGCYVMRAAVEETTDSLRLRCGQMNFATGRFFKSDVTVPSWSTLGDDNFYIRTLEGYPSVMVVHGTDFVMMLNVLNVLTTNLVYRRCILETPVPTHFEMDHLSLDRDTGELILSAQSFMSSALPSPPKYEALWWVWRCKL